MFLHNWIVIGDRQSATLSANMPGMAFPDFTVTGRTALITGSARGIGLAMAKTLAAGGAAVAIQDIDYDVALSEAAAIRDAGGRAVGLGGDLTDLSLPDRLVEQTVAELGPISILINNGSIQHYGNFFDHPIERMRQELDANILAATRLCQLVIPAMQQAKWGRVINFSSIQAKNGNPSAPSYAMSRAAMENLTRGLGRRFARDGITVNCISPGWFDTYRNRNDLTSEEVKIDRGRHVPIGRLGKPEDCAGLCLLLCSRAGEYITGQVINVDGGMG